MGTYNKTDSQDSVEQELDEIGETEDQEASSSSVCIQYIWMMKLRIIRSLWFL